MRRWLLTVVVAAALIAGGVLWSQRHSSAATTRYLTSAVQRGTVAETVAATGSVEPQTTLSLTFGGASSNSSGNGAGNSSAANAASQSVASGSAVVQSVSVALGASVAAGQVLATLSDTTQLGQLQLAQAQLAAAQAKQASEPAGASADVVSGDAVAVAQAQQQLTTAQHDVDATRLIAPIAGVITAVNVSPGLPPPSGAAFTERSVTLVVVASIAEQDVTKLVPGQQARCSFPALGTSVAATLTSLPTAASSASGSSAAVTFPVSLAIAHPPANLLSGMSAQISITIARRPNALEVPTSAVQGASTTPTVQVLVGGKLTSRPVEIGLATESFTEILAGLQVGDIVVTGVVNPASTTTGGGLGGGGLGGGGGFRTFRGARGGAGGG